LAHTKFPLPSNFRIKISLPFEARFGANVAQSIVDQEIWGGMTKEMFIESWEEPELEVKRKIEGIEFDVWQSTGQNFYFKRDILEKWVWSEDDSINFDEKES